MSFTPFLSAPLLIQCHATLALVAILLGPVVIHRRRRDRLHKWLGYVWVVAMSLVAATAVFIPANGLALIGSLGPIHLFVGLAVWSLWTGMAAIYRGDRATHEAALKGLYWQGLAIAGLFNFLPGRVVNRTLFPDAPNAGLVVLAVGAVALAWVALRQYRGAQMARP